MTPGQKIASLTLQLTRARDEYLAELERDDYNLEDLLDKAQILIAYQDALLQVKFDSKIKVSGLWDMAPWD